MKVRFITLIAVFLLTTKMFGQNIEWAKQITPKSNVKASVAVDRSGNSYLLGLFKDTCVIDGISVYLPGSNNIYLAKFNASGIVQWIKTATGNFRGVNKDICVDISGNIYVTGCYNNTANIGGNILPGTGSFIAKYDSSGSVIWVHSIDTTNSTISANIIAGDSGSIFVSGKLLSTLDLGCSILNYNGGLNNQQQFLVRYDTSGTCQWGITYSASYLYDLTVDVNNNTYITGGLVGQGVFGSDSINSNGYNDIYLAKCNANGTWDWAQSFGSAEEDDLGWSVSTNKWGHIYLTGDFHRTVTFGNITLTATAMAFNPTSQVTGADIFIARFNESGLCQWVKQAGGGHGNHYGFAIASNNLGNTVISGSIIDTTHFGNYTIIPNGEKTYVAEYDSTGFCNWAIVSGGQSGDRGLVIQTDTIGNIFLTGQFFWNGNYSFGSFMFNVLYHDCNPNPFPSPGSWYPCSDIYLIKINSLITDVESQTQQNDDLIRLYPNPFTDILNISINSEISKMTFELYDIYGRKIFVKELSGSKEISLENIKKGMYFYKVFKNGIYQSGKLIKD